MLSCLDFIKDLHQNYKGQGFMIWWINIPHFLHPTSTILFHHMGTLGVAHWIISFNWRRNVHMIISKIVVFQNMVPQRFISLRLPLKVKGMELTLLHACSQEENYKQFGWCLTIVNVWKGGLPWHVMCMIQFIPK